MKKRFLSLLLAICMIIPCVFMLNACDTCEHHWVLRTEPTLETTGILGCNVCGNIDRQVEIPKLNDKDYEIDDTNPDNIIYTYTIDGQSVQINVSNFTWSVVTDMGAWIDGYTGNSSNVVIPDNMLRRGKEVPVVTCGQNVFEDNTNIVSVVLPSSIKIVSDNAFLGCTNLQKVYYKGSQTQWDNVSVYDTGNDAFFTATVYYYSDTQPSVADYIESDYALNTWHYDENNNIDLWIKYTNNVENKSFTYSHSEVSLSDTYWAMLKEAENQGLLGDLFDNDQAQIEMVTSSATKAEYETKFATWYGTTMGTGAVTSFADGKAIVTLMGNSIQTDYIEINGEVWYTTSKEKAFAFDTTNNSIYAEQSNDYYTIRHIYSIVE